MKLHIVCLAAVLGISGALRPVRIFAQTEPATEPVRIALRPSAAVPERLVTLADLAVLSGGDENLRQRLARLDVSDPPTERGTRITQTRVQFRVLLDGVPQDQFRLAGAAATRVRLDTATLDDQVVLSALRRSLAAHFHVAEEDIYAQLRQPIGEEAAREIGGRTVTLEPLLPQTFRPGQVQLNMAAREAGNLVATFPVVVDVRIYVNVAKPVVPIGRGEVLTDQNVQQSRIPLSGYLLDQYAPRAQGLVARRGLSIGEIIKRTDLQEPPQERIPYAVNPRDKVRIVARKAGLTVVLDAAEVLERGRLGDTIRVRNMNSRRIVTGQLTSPSEVEIKL